MIRLTWTKLIVVILGILLSVPGFRAGGLAEVRPEEDMSVRLEMAESGESKIEYAQVSGLADEEIQAMLNAYLKWFSVDNYLDEDVDRAWDTVEGRTAFAIVGGRYLSVYTEYLFSGKEMAYPWGDVQARVFDLTIGEPDTQLSDYLTTGPELNAAIADGTFTIFKPDVTEEQGIDFLARFAQDYGVNYEPDYYNTDFYLTEDGLGLFVHDRIHAEGDYWMAEAAYDKLGGLMTPMLEELLKP
ncbi:hypothetical protein FACS1894184_10350 [Clostridia bacterium]|nr:hypothetical protein FACS1894184_10350 [Clostridia bacterium]